MGKRKKEIIGLIGLIFIIAALFIIYQIFSPKTVTGNKTITVSVVHQDLSTKNFTYHTDATYLGEVLQNEHLVTGKKDKYGLFITTVDGETADETKQQWWCITKSGEQLNTSADSTPISDGDTYELTLTEGY